MNVMHFEGTIINADFHASIAPLQSYMELRIMIDVMEEIMIEVIGTDDVLSKKFETDISGITNGNNELLDKKCKVLRDAGGYHFISLS